MVDVVSQKKRSQMMSGIKGKDTRPERHVRRLLHANGFRYRLHPKDLPGKPDMVFPKYGCVLLVNGCFWHRHECHLFKWPKTRQQFWRRKIQSNKARDADQMGRLMADGWRVIVVWECAVKGKESLDEQVLVDLLVAAIRGQKTFTEITGSKTPIASQET